MGPRQETFCMFALYNRWANQQLYQACERCTTEQLREDRGAFFRSILGTLNHILVTDRMWLRRLKGDSPRAVNLGETLYEDFPDLAEARADEDQRIAEFVHSLSEQQIGAPLTYRTTSGASQTQPMHELLSHVFNHQTHHRGQAHDLLGQALLPANTPVLDLLHYQRAFASADAL